MQLRYLDEDPTSHATELLAVAVAQGTDSPTGHLAGLDRALGGAVGRALSAGDIRGRATEEVLLYGGETGPKRILLLGVGKPAELTAETLRRMSGRAVRAAERLRIESLSVLLDGLDGVDEQRRAQAAAEGAALAAWRFSELKAPDEEEPATEVHAVDLLGAGDAEALGIGTVAGAILARGENFARTLQSRPGNVATPSHLAEEAARLAEATNLGITVFDEARMLEEGMHAILAVSRGSDEEARLIVLEHRGGGDGEPPLVLVGKGLSFDAGGISLKPAAGMESMKFDMSGGAAVLGAMQAIDELGVKANVVGIVPSSENLPSGRALKPGDVIRTLAGKTVEVINTDAEGRLILADALAYGARLGPAAMVDCATLTGAVVVALGSHASGVLGNDEELVGELLAAGETSGERCWQLPLWDDYRRQLDSETADLLNIGGREGSTITAACFLSEFVGDSNWAHLDVAGTAYGEGKLPYQRKGGYGVPTRLLVEWVRSRAG
ncbi:MAG TPA: leucyl aminopeptidase [Longimicrobiales bacterium]|nr:leucyl aminopeptidase [Longimicrobiales bacterium]